MRVDQHVGERMKPIIGITVEPLPEPDNERTQGILRLNWNYAQVIMEAGGVPVMIPPQADAPTVIGMIDGLLIPGGRDIDASQFGQENHPAAELQHPSRFAIEKALFDAAPADMPLLGICYGCQFLNVARGGTLQQHLPDVLGHDEHSGGTWEPVTLREGSQLASLMGTERVEGRSYHHQAVDALGTGLVITGRAADGTVEALEDPSRPFLMAVQWHPERSYRDKANRKLIERFVTEASKYAGQKRNGPRYRCEALRQR